MDTFLTSEKAFASLNFWDMEMRLEAGGCEDCGATLTQCVPTTSILSASRGLAPPQNKGSHTAGQTVNKRWTGKWRVRWRTS